MEIYFKKSLSQRRKDAENAERGRGTQKVTVTMGISGDCAKVYFVYKEVKRPICNIIDRK